MDKIAIAKPCARTYFNQRNSNMKGPKYITLVSPLGRFVSLVSCAGHMTRLHTLDPRTSDEYFLTIFVGR